MLSKDTDKKVILGNKNFFFAESAESILTSAKKSGLVLDYSCNNGQCGICSCTLLSGEVDNTTDNYHSEVEKALGKILTCQALPLTDIEIDIDDLGEYAKYPPKILPARVSSINAIAKDIVKLTLRMPPNNRISYLPGQYVDLISGSIKRSYSLANTPRENGTVDLIIKRVADGKMSEILFNDTKNNDLLRVEGPLGTFGWRDSVKNNVVFLVTGTGIAPALAMINSLQFSDKNIYLIWGNRLKEDFFELNLEEKNLQQYKVLSREYADGYKSGYVQDVLCSLDIDLADATVYACGSAAMIKVSRTLLVESGLDPKSFYSDSFVSSGK